MKLVAWLGGPMVVEDKEFPDQFICLPSEEEWAILFSMDVNDVDCFLPLEVDE